MWFMSLALTFTVRMYESCSSLSLQDCYYWCKRHVHYSITIYDSYTAKFRISFGLINGICLVLMIHSGDLGGM